MFGRLYWILLLFTVLATVAGLLTLMPRDAASYPNLIGYQSLCTFAPAATFFCFLAAGVACFLRSAFVKDRSGSPGERFRRHWKGLAVLTAVLVLALLFTRRYVDIKAQYIDAGAGASVIE